ncbi:MAG: hypothetical protein HS126_21695 [Anaerolineales bacterium]|nr:hypothetical protein [Anaerolineales bacterium]
MFGFDAAINQLLLQVGIDGPLTRLGGRGVEKDKLGQGIPAGQAGQFGARGCRDRFGHLVGTEVDLAAGIIAGDVDNLAGFLAVHVYHRELFEQPGVEAGLVRIRHYFEDVVLVRVFLAEVIGPVSQVSMIRFSSG